MALGIDDINNKEFKRKFRGYDELQVDEFLDELCAAVSEYQSIITRMNEELMRAAAQREHMNAMEAQLRSALNNSKAEADRMMADVARKGIATLQDAQAQAASIIEEARVSAANYYNAARAEAERIVAAAYAEREAIFRQG